MNYHRVVDGLGRTALIVATEAARHMPGPRSHFDENMLLDRREDIDFPGLIAKLLEDDVDDDGDNDTNNNHGRPSQAATLTFPNGRLSLHHALHHGLGMADGLEPILRAHPNAVSVVDPITGLLPCLLAAVGLQAKVDSIYNCFMKRPNLLADLIAKKDVDKRF